MSTTTTLAEATAAVQAAIATYAQARDAGRIRDVVATFAPTGVLEIPAMGTLTQGHEALTQNYSQFVLQGPSRHIFTNMSIRDWDDREIHASCDVVVINKGDEGWTIGMVGRYNDVLQNVNGSWLFTRRTLTFA